MDSINEVLEAVKAYCKEKTSDATYAFYIKDIKAVSFENSNTITLELRSEFVMKIVSDRYTALLKEAFKAILGFDVEILYVAAPPEDGEKADGSADQRDEKSLPSGRYDFTFENFIKGPSNQFAFAAAQAVAANPSGAYNPLFIYGPSGLGKTHLLNAIQFEIKKNHPDFNIVYVDCEMFTNETISAIKTATMEQFRQKYRKADVLLIDDIQFLAGKESTQEEFFHTFNTLHNDGRQIVIASDRPANHMALFAVESYGSACSRTVWRCRPGILLRSLSAVPSRLPDHPSLSISPRMMRGRFARIFSTGQFHHCSSSSRAGVLSSKRGRIVLAGTPPTIV